MVVDLIDEFYNLESSDKKLFDELVYKFFYLCATSSNSLIVSTDISEYIRSNQLARVQELWSKVDYSNLSPITYWLKDRVEEEISKKGLDLVIKKEVESTD